ncbi:GPR1/FUN34/yaaH family-domain-containing protein [Roridomyces roridus]|uniref:GPR1/FUN34/yaaH family-domain-containing protein n=1 Tax=Roridomyces roridus TaxID=1738132 RepID=A0AAD7BP32_9AGAR|nr:GPR1/FUN34/yaaH family-domain-containing protein [Roridomyces roridus]
MSDKEQTSVEYREHYVPGRNATERGPMVPTTEGPAHPSGIANPVPMGLFAFAGTTFILSMVNVQTRAVTHSNIVLGMAMFAGGLTQFIAGMWQFPRGNVFGATVFSSYGSFWMSYGSIFIPFFGIADAYEDPQELANAIGIYLIVWLMLTLFFLLAVIRVNLAYSSLLGVFSMCYTTLIAAEFTGSVRLTKAGGVFGIAGALIAYYIGVSEMLEAEKTAIVRLPLGVWQ